jgi:CHASE1-domain containing sensor protein
MAKSDSAKEELGWLKVVFAVSAAIDASLVAWLAQKYTSADIVLLALAFVVAAVLTAYVVRMNSLAYRRIRELKDF